MSTTGAAGNQFSIQPAISRDGRYVAYLSFATNLVTPDVNGTGDVVVRDRQANTTTRVTVTTGGAQANWLSWTRRSVQTVGT